MAEDTFDLVVIGAGPGGYVAAIRAAQLGMRVACVEKQYLGGTCLNVGCIPSKAMLDSSEKFYAVKHSYARLGINAPESSLDLQKMQARKDQVVKTLTSGVGGLFRKNKVEHVRGSARIVSPESIEVSGEGHGRVLRTKNILIATGSAPVQLAGLPFDGKHIVSSTEALEFPEVPKRLIVVGAGYIGVELGSVWSRLGSDVLVLEFLDRCVPRMDREMGAQLQRSLERQGLKFRFNTTAESAQVQSDTVKLTWASGDQRGPEECDKVLVAVGRRPVTDGLGLDQIGVQTDKKGFVLVDEQFRTNIPGIWAIGDVIGGPMLAHKAEDEGIAAVENMARKAGHVNYQAIPTVVYTHPELAQVGMSEEEASNAGRELKVGRFPLLANGRARCMDETEGQAKIIADARTDRVLGVHILAAHASDMIAEAVLAMELGASSEDIARTSHAHPTLSEAVREAAMGVEGRAIHI